jgi:uncharacterized protein
MNGIVVRLGASAVALAVSQAVSAGTNPFFNPLTQSSAVASPNHINELNSPWQTPAGISQNNLLSMQEVEADATQSILRVDAGTSSSMFDMIAYDPTARYFFIPHETPFGAGVARYNIANDRNEVLFAGDQEAATNDLCESDPQEPRDPTKSCPAWDNDYAAFDPARWTPNGTVILGEEWAGLGRVVEIMNPLGPAPADPTATSLTKGVDYRVLESVAKVSHEGIQFSQKFANRVIYYIDEWNSGSIYALVLKKPGDYAGGGKTFVLSVDAFAPSGGDPAANWDEGSNATAARHGLATWVPLTNWNGKSLPGVRDPFVDGPTDDPRTNPDTRGGRGAADDVGGTPYGRPEDMEVGVLPNGHEILYITVTSEQAVISVEILPGAKAMVREFATRETPKNLGFPATTGELDSPDNLAQDALGNIYIIEDWPNSSDVGGDIWFVRDTDNDGVAESLDHFMSLQVAGSESTGMIFNPIEPTKFVVAVQHPSSTDLAVVPEGFGDAVWEFDVESVVPPTCDGTNNSPVYSWKTRDWVSSCSEDYDFNFANQLERAGSPAPEVVEGGLE